MSGAAGSVDQHVVIITALGSFTAAGERLTGVVDSVDELEKLIEWAHNHGGLQPIPAVRDGTDTEPARLWVVGAVCRQLIGSSFHAAAAPVEQLGHALAPLVGRGWELRSRRTAGLVPARGRGPRRVFVEVLAEPQPWISAGAGEVAEDAAELGRRLRQWYAALSTLPAASGAACGAVLSDHVMRGRVGRRGAAVSTPEVLPAWVVPDMRIQPPWCASAAEVEEQFERSEELLCLEQLCPALASAGMLTFGYGPPQALESADAAAAAAAPKRAFGLWRVMLPPANDLQLPAMPPAPHPQMRAATPVQAWVSNEDLDGLAKDVRDGDAGLSVEQLAVDEAIVWPQQGRILQAWATRLREARETFIYDPPLRELVEAAALQQRR